MPKAHLCAFFAPSLALALFACAPDPLAIVHNQRPIAGSCALSTTPMGDSIREGVFDLAIGDRFSYLITPIIENHAGSPVEIQRARVELDWEIEGELERLRIRCDGGGFCDEWELEVCSGRCAEIPAGGTVAHEVPALPRVATAYFRDMMDGAVAEGRTPPEFRVVARVSLEGVDQDMNPVIGQPFEIDLRICLGCLVEFPPGTDSPAIVGEDCCGGGTPPAECLLGQDAPIDCRHCIRTLPEICNFGRLSCGS
jgi:hypothetical protein